MYASTFYSCKHFYEFYSLFALSTFLPLQVISITIGYMDWIIVLLDNSSICSTEESNFKIKSILNISIAAIHYTLIYIFDPMKTSKSVSSNFS